MTDTLTAVGKVKVVYDNAFVLTHEDGRDITVRQGKDVDPEMPWPKVGQCVSVDFNPWSSKDGKKHYNYIQSLAVEPGNVTPMHQPLPQTEPLGPRTVVSVAENRDRLICRQVVFKTLMERAKPDGTPMYEPDFAAEFAKDLGDRLAEL